MFEAPVVVVAVVIVVTDVPDYQDNRRSLQVVSLPEILLVKDTHMLLLIQPLYKPDWTCATLHRSAAVESGRAT